ncbi:phage protein NinX family protein [Serratia nevei]|uniref:phage protein NinX family protein n=1 Tax=Serratia nevei TaxID=2703794 RepID=UPI003FA713C8
MNDYSKMSDFEIDKAVAEITGDSKPTDEEWGINRIIPDYCNNPSDAWPIIVENKINIEWHEWKGGEFKPYALNNETMKSSYDDKPLRAAMIVFLMMKDAESKN